MADVIFEDYSIEVKNAMNNKINAVLHEVAGEVVSQTKRNTRVDTGQTKNSWMYYVDYIKHEATIGSPLENAIWEEFGTGEYALNGNGRLGGWSYKDAKDKWHHTYGKTPTRAFWKAFTGLKNAIINRIQEVLKGL